MLFDCVSEKVGAAVKVEYEATARIEEADQ